MPKANALPSTRRRTLFTSAFAASLMAATGCIAQAEANPDAQLLQVCDQFNTTHTIIQKIEAGPETEFGSPESIQKEKSLDYFVVREEQLLDQISEMPAHTQAGILAKAGVIQKYLPQYVDEYEAAPESSQIRIILSLMDDLLGRKIV